jgi:prefoldin subunit 5
MNEGTARDRFLQAEAEASRLASVLEDLRKETQSYQTVTRTLDEVARSTRTSATSLQPVLDGLGGLIRGLAELGLPELREEVSELKSAVRRIEESVEVMRHTQSEALARRGDAETMSVGVTSLDRAVRELGAIQRWHGWITLGAVIVVGIVLMAIQSLNQ